MTLNLYVMPIIGAGTISDQRRPKYVSTFNTFSWGMFDYGNEPWCLVGVIDIDATTDAALNANADVNGLPVNLSNTLGGARTTVQNDLEAVNIPGTWVLTSNTWRDVVLFVGGCCQFAQRFQGQTGGRWFGGSVTLDSTFNSLGATVRNGLQAAAQSFGFDTSGITSTSTLRQIIQSAGQQYVSMNLPLSMASIDLYTGLPLT
jgi:hypothetical protein